MTLEIAFVLGILSVSLVLFVTEKLRMDLVSLLVLGTLAISGLVTPEEAVSGFSNPAVITVWAMFILSDGLTRTGIANLLGYYVLRLAGSGETKLIVVIMLTAGALSAFMNNIGVAALMLPVVMDISRRTETAPSRLLMPLAYGCLLGGLTTLIGTPPNLLASQALEQNGHPGFQLFDFLPLGSLVLGAGALFVALSARYLLPVRDPSRETHQRSQRNLRAQYGLQELTFTLSIPDNSVLVGKHLAESRLATATGLIVIAIMRRGRTDPLPSRQTVLEAGDKLLVQGRLDRFNELRKWSELVIEREAPLLQGLMSDKVQLVEAALTPDSPLIAEPLHHTEFRHRYGVNVLAIRRDNSVRRINLSNVPLKEGDRLLLQGRTEALEALRKATDFGEIAPVSKEELTDLYRLQERVFVVRVPRESQIPGHTLAASRLGDAFDFRQLAIFRESELQIMPEPDTILHGGDLLLIQGRPEHVDVLRGLQEMEIDPGPSHATGVFRSDRLTMLEATPDPRSAYVGKKISELRLRDSYGLELLAIWRKGQAIRSELDGLTLELGDALLLLGPRNKLADINRDPEFLVLTPVPQEPPNTKKAPLAAAIMAAVVVVVMLGWYPIYIMAILGAASMVLTRCLSMEEAYRSIEWRAIFLIAGMLPLGTAMQQTGAASYLANGVISLLGELGPMPVLMGLYLVTALATMIIPTAALVVLMSPIVLFASSEMGVAPQTGMMAIALAASASFTSPISHPANLLVMGPGGYAFKDYLRVGIPLTLVVMLVVFVFLPVIWPLQPA